MRNPYRPQGTLNSRQNANQSMKEIADEALRLRRRVPSCHLCTHFNSQEDLNKYDQVQARADIISNICFLEEFLCV